MLVPIGTTKDMPLAVIWRDEPLPVACPKLFLLVAALCEPDASALGLQQGRWPVGHGKV